MSNKCEHKFKPYATINYIVPIELYDDGKFGFFFQDKIYECQECYAQKVITRACKVGVALRGGMGIGIESEFERVPLWYEMVEGGYTNTIHGSVYSVLKNRKLDNDEYPSIDLSQLILNGKTVIYKKIINI